MDTPKYRMVRADLHLHTAHSDNHDKLLPADYLITARRAGIEVLGFADHHHNLTQASWAALQEQVAALKDEGILLVTGYEATYIDGHMVITDKDQFDGEFVADMEAAVHNPKNVRILAHPDNNSCQWNLNMAPGIDGVEVANGGQDEFCVREGSPCNGLATFKDYLLLGERVAPFSNSDCHQAVFFGRMWTGVWIPADAPLTRQTLFEAIRARRTLASYGGLELEFGTGGGEIMGDIVESQEPALRWNAPAESRLTLYRGDMPIAHFRGGPGEYKPTTNGAWWLLAEQGASWAVASPIWVRGIHHAGHVAPLHEALLDNDLLAELTAQAETLLAQAADLLSERYNARPAFALPYMPWLHSQLPADLPIWLPANRDPADLQQEYARRLRLVIRVASRLLADMLAAAGPAEPEPGDRLAWLHSLDGLPLPPIVQCTVEVPQCAGPFHLTTVAGAPLNYVAAPAPHRDPVNEFRTPGRMEEILVWLERGEMHEYALQNVEMRGEGDTLYTTFDLFRPRWLAERPAYPQEAARLAAILAEGGYARYHLHIRKPQRWVVQLLSAPLGDGVGEGQPVAVRLAPGESPLPLAERMAAVYGVAGPRPAGRSANMAAIQHRWPAC